VSEVTVLAAVCKEHSFYLMATNKNYLPEVIDYPLEMWTEAIQ
jgi:hypothetical protein